MMLPLILRATAKIEELLNGSHFGGLDLKTEAMGQAVLAHQPAAKKGAKR